MTKRPGKALLLLVALITALALPAATVVAQEGGTIIAEGFNAPQGILVDESGNIWVVDSGVGGETEFEMTDPVSGEPSTATYGDSARIVRIDPDGTQTDVAVLPSVLVGDEATGGARLALLNDELYVTSGAWFGDGEENAAPMIPNTAAVLKLNADGTLEQVAPTWRIEKRMNPDNTVFESNPYGLAVGPDGKLWVADAAANTLLRIDPNSSVVELVTTFPAIPGVFPNPNRGGEMLTDPVPTGVAFDDEGNAYVSLLSGAPFVPGSASVVKVAPGGARSDYATNLTMLTDIRRGPDGDFYAVQHAVFTDQGPTPNSGAIIKIAEGEESVPVVEGLSFPTSIDFDADGNAYITINGVGP
jgi:sugar lactone lactonase YvrE